MDSKTRRLAAMGVPAMPKWILYLQIGIMVLALGVLIAAAYNLSEHADNIYTNVGPASFLVFDVVFTWITLGVMIGFQFYLPRFYYRLAFIVFLGLAVIFWLCSWAWAAFMANHVGGLSRFYWSHGNAAYKAAMTACAVLGAFIWVALIVLTIFFTLFCLRDDTDPTGPNTGPHHGDDAEMATRGPEEMADSSVSGAHPPQQAHPHPADAHSPYLAQQPHAVPTQPRYG